MPTINQFKAAKCQQKTTNNNTSVKLYLISFMSQLCTLPDVLMV